MESNSIVQKLKNAYVELEGENYNVKHFRQNSGRYLKIIEYILPFSRDIKILDIGCGFCYLTTFLKHQGFEVQAIDFYYGDIPKFRCQQSGVPFFQLNIEVDDLPFGEAFFDIILLGEVLEHLNFSPLVPLTKIRRALKRDGRLILTTPNARRLVNPFKLMLGHNIYPDLKSYYQEPILYKGQNFFYRHNRLYTMKELRQLIFQSGFRTLSSSFISQGMYWGDHPGKVIFKCFALPLLLTFSSLRDFLLVVAEK